MASVRRSFRLFWWIICCLAFLALPLAVWDFTRKGYDIKYQAWFIGGIFAILSVPISTYGVAMHTEYYTRPRLQRHVIRILWMVPIYSVDAWFALRFRSAREYLDPIRECYEAYVIYNFFAYLMAYLEEELGDVEAHLARKPPMKHLPPFKWILGSWPMGHPFLLACKQGIMNYVILRPITTFISLITDIFGLYGQGRVDFSKSYVYLTATTNFSQLYALYCLGQMYWAVHKELAPIRPLSKFICIKSVVFLTFWQGTILAVLVSSGVIADNSWSSYDQLGVATGIQDFLICIEMFVAALAHSFAFPPKDYMHPSDQVELDGGFLHNVKHMFDLRDVGHDLHMVFGHHMGTASIAAKTAIVTLPKAGLKQTAQKLGFLKKNPKEDVRLKRWPEARSQAEGDAQAYYPMQHRNSEGGGIDSNSDSNSDSESDASGLVGRSARKNVQEDEELGQGGIKRSQSLQVNRAGARVMGDVTNGGSKLGARSLGAMGWEAPLAAAHDDDVQAALLGNTYPLASGGLQSSTEWEEDGKGRAGRMQTAMLPQPQGAPASRGVRAGGEGRGMRKAVSSMVLTDGLGSRHVSCINSNSGSSSSNNLEKSLAHAEQTREEARVVRGLSGQSQRQEQQQQQLCYPQDVGMEQLQYEVPLLEVKQDQQQQHQSHPQNQQHPQQQSNQQQGPASCLGSSDHDEGTHGASSQAHCLISGGTHVENAGTGLHLPPPAPPQPPPPPSWIPPSSCTSGKC